MLKLFKYPSIFHCRRLSKRLNNFYKTSFQRPDIPSIPHTFLRWEHHLKKYLPDVCADISMYEIIQEPTDDLCALRDDLQTLLKYAF